MSVSKTSFSQFIRSIEIKLTQLIRRRRISIDLGTANTLIYEHGSGIVLDQASVVAMKAQPGQEPYVVSVGTDAKHMLGRTPINIQVIRPLKDGVIADFHVTEKMLQHFMHLMHKHRYFSLRPDVVICVPSGSTQVERRAIKESALGAGARRVYLIEEPMAAAIGAGLQVHESNASMVVDIGGGTTEVAIISLNGIVCAQSVRIGGDRFDESIIAYVRRNYCCHIGEATAERIKKELGTAFPTHDIKEMQVSGQNITDGIPKSFMISSNEVLEALQEPLNGIVHAIRHTLEHAPPELSGDLEQRGMVLTGGGALLANLDRLISEETGLPVWVADEPLTCVVRGGGMVLEHLYGFGQDFVSSS